MSKNNIQYYFAKVGNKILGNGYEIITQSMTNTDTNDISATVAQVKRIAEAGADMVRITVPSMKEVEAMKAIKEQLHSEGITIPLIADVHFSSKVAESVAPFVEKVRINPGNFTDRRNFKQQELTEEEYAKAVAKMALQAKPLFDICTQHKTAIRIGVNHGSLCDRIVNRYGNGALGMVMSAMEWVHICQSHNFHNVVFSMKSSNVNMMIESTLLLVEKMQEAGTVYPLHLGVTEAGSGLDGRVKSAAGTGALLLSGVGNTIRISLTEKPENEIPFAKTLIEVTQTEQKNHYQINEERILTYSYPERDKDKWIAAVSAVCGYEHFKNKLKDIIIQNPHFSQEEINELTSAVLQACRIKINKTEIISCPTCGRTQYDIESAVAIVKEKFGHYPNLKIGVMGCIVNGPGEMADADMGIVGATNGNVVVYKGKEKVSGIVTLQEGIAILYSLIEELS